jgi:hypothetical protein
MLASKGCQANAQSQKSYNYSQCQINAPLYLFVFLKKNIQYGVHENHFRISLQRFFKIFFLVLHSFIKLKQQAK